MVTSRTSTFPASQTARRFLGVAALVVCSVGIAYETASGKWVTVLGLIVVCAAFVVGIYDWRLSVYGLLVYLPVSGVAIVLAYSKTNLAVLIKDVLFVIPAYVGFLILARRHGWRVPGAPIMAIAVLTFLIVIECFNPSQPNPLVALVGVKVWLLYIPLLFLGYHFVRSKEELQSVLGLMTAVAIIPAAIGIVEAIAIYAGHAQQVYALYGQAAAAVTHQFGQTNFSGGGFSRRIPSTFSFEAQYFGFLASMLAIAFAWWRLSGRRVAGAVACSILLLAACTSGARAAFIMIPLLVVLIVLLDGRLGYGATTLLAVAGAVLGAASLFGADPASVISTAANIGVSETQGHFLPDVTAALQSASLGLGTGYSTLSARNVLVGQIDPRFVTETWYAKVILELGIAGLLTVVVLFAQLLAYAYRAHRRVRDSGLKAFSSAIIAFLVWNLIYMTKGGWIDLDPINVYFWLFAGILLRVAALNRDAVSTPAQNSKPVRPVVG